MANKQVQVGERQITVEPFSGRKGIQVLRAIEHISNAVPDIQTKWAEYTRQYEATNTIDIDRALARVEMGPQPLMNEEPLMSSDGERVLTDDLGRALVRRTPMLDGQGRVMMGADPLGHITEADWQASGNKLRRPRSPRVEEQVLAVLGDVMQLAEEQLAKLLGLISLSNADVKRYSREGALWEKAAQLGDDILDAPMNEIAELAVVCGEALQEEFRTQIRDRLGERLVQAARLLGFDLSKMMAAPEAGPQSNETPSTTSPDSSTGSPSPTAGERSGSSTERAGAGSAT